LSRKSHEGAFSLDAAAQKVSAACNRFSWLSRGASTVFGCPSQIQVGGLTHRRRSRYLASVIL
jgi:hypothetical protein